MEELEIVLKRPVGIEKKILLNAAALIEDILTHKPEVVPLIKYDVIPINEYISPNLSINNNKIIINSITIKNMLLKKTLGEKLKEFFKDNRIFCELFPLDEVEISRLPETKISEDKAISILEYMVQPDQEAINILSDALVDIYTDPGCWEIVIQDQELSETGYSIQFNDSTFSFSISDLKPSPKFEVILEEAFNDLHEKWYKDKPLAQSPEDLLE